MIEREKISPQKIIHINLAYDFSLYDKPNQEEVDRLRNQYTADVILLCITRLVPHKRPEMAVMTVKKLKEMGLTTKLIVLGKGILMDSLIAQAQELNLTDCIIFPGYVNNVLDYMAAADFLLHPSVSESSCVVVKEAGLVQLPVIVNKGVGDFDEVIIHERNGFLVNSDTFAEEATQVIFKKYLRKSELADIGKRLEESVRERFSITNIAEEYNALNGHVI